MRQITKLIFMLCLGPFFGANACVAQMYTVTDLGSLEVPGFPPQSCVTMPRGINNSGQVVGTVALHTLLIGAFRTAPNTPINSATDNLGTLGSSIPTAGSDAQAINALGQVVGSSYTATMDVHAFRTAPNSALNPATDDLGTLGGIGSSATGVNDLGQVVGHSGITGETAWHAFRTAPNSQINPATDDLGTLGGTGSSAVAINDLGQVAGDASISGDTAWHAFRTAPNSRINPVTDDLGTLGGTVSYSTGINNLGQVVGDGRVAGDTAWHAFRTAPNRPINPAKDDLGTLDGATSHASGINRFGEVVGDSGGRGFIYSNGLLQDLNDLIPANSGCVLYRGISINDVGQIAGQGFCNTGLFRDAILLTPIYKASVQPPVKADRTSVFNRARVIPLKFILTAYGASTCTLLPATLAITRIAGEPFGRIEESTYLSNANDGSNFRIAPGACQYIYNLPASALGVGQYQADININGISVGHAVFALK